MYNGKMSKGRLCIDIDNVLAQTDEVMRDVIRKHSVSGVDLRYEDVVEFDYRKCKDANGNKLICSGDKDEWKEIHEEFSKAENIRRIKPVGGVQEHLLKLIDEGFHLHFVTSRLVSARIATIKWLKAHNFPDHSLHFVGHGEKHLCLAGFTAAIEDDCEQAYAFAETGTPAYLIAHPWNVLEEGSSIVRVNNWGDLVNRLLAGP